MQRKNKIVLGIAGFMLPALLIALVLWPTTSAQAEEASITWSGDLSVTDERAEDFASCGPAGWRLITDWSIVEETVPLSAPGESGARSAIVHMVPTSSGTFQLTHSSTLCDASPNQCGYTAEWSSVHAEDAVEEPIAVQMLLYPDEGRLAIKPAYGSAAHDWVLKMTETNKPHAPCDTTPYTSERYLTQGYGLPRFELEPLGFPARDDRLQLHATSPSTFVVDGPFTAEGSPDISQTTNFSGMPFGSWFNAYLAPCAAGNPCAESEVKVSSSIEENLSATVSGIGFVGPSDSCPTPTASFGASWSPGTESFNASTSSSPFPSHLSSYTWDFGDGKSGTGLTTPHEYAKAGEYDVTLTVRNDCGKEATRTDSVTYDPPTTYAPAVHFHPHEHFFPGSAKTFIRHSRLRWIEPNEAGCRDETISDKPSAAKLGLSSSNPYRHQAVRLSGGKCMDSGKTVKATDAAAVEKKKPGFLLEATNSLSLVGKSSGAPVYAEYNPGRWIIYWFFYPYNFWEGGKHLIEMHEADWEHIAIRLDGRDHYLGASFAQHNCPPKSADKVTFTEGTHPDVFSALGGHASYPTDGLLGKQIWQCKGGVTTSAFYDNTGRGEIWRTWEKVRDVRAEPWYGFGGAWGDKGHETKQQVGLQKFCFCVYGPAGPGPRKLSGALPSGW